MANYRKYLTSFPRAENARDLEEESEHEDTTSVSSKISMKNRVEKNKYIALSKTGGKKRQFKQTKTTSDEEDAEVEKEDAASDGQFAEEKTESINGDDTMSAGEDNEEMSILQLLGGKQKKRNKFVEKPMSKNHKDLKVPTSKRSTAFSDNDDSDVEPQKQLQRYHSKASQSEEEQKSNNNLGELWSSICNTMSTVKLPVLENSKRRKIMLKPMIYDYIYDLQYVKLSKIINSNVLGDILNSCKKQIEFFSWHNEIPYNNEKISMPSAQYEYDKMSLLEETDEEFYNLLIIFYKATGLSGVEFFENAPFSVVPTIFDNDHLNYLSDKIIHDVEDDIIKLEGWFLMPIIEQQPNNTRAFPTYAVEQNLLHKIVAHRINALTDGKLGNKKLLINLSRRQNIKTFEIFSNNLNDQKFGLISLINCSRIVKKAKKKDENSGTPSTKGSEYLAVKAITQFLIK